MNVCLNCSHLQREHQSFSNGEGNQWWGKCLKRSTPFNELCCKCEKYEFRQGKKTILEVIVELTGETPVQYSGELKAIRCPFHNDHKPSLVIYEKTSSYFCFPCSTGGDMYNFYSRFKECSYKAAKEALDGNTDILTEITETLDGLHVVPDEVDYSDELNMTISKFCRDLMYRKPELTNNVMEFLKKFDGVLQSKKISAIIMKETIARAKELEK